MTKKEDTGVSSTSTILRVLELMESGLRNPITFADLARQVGYSPWYLASVFRSVTGTSPGKYLRVRRLSDAATELVRSERSVTAIALEYQFTSPETFARAFNRAFGLSPMRFRKRTRATSSPGRGGYMEPRIIGMGKLCLVGMVCYKDGGTGKLWQYFIPKILSIPGRVEIDTIYELHFRSNSDVFFMPSVAVSSLVDVPVDMLGKTLPAAEYGMFVHRGPASRLGETYKYIYDTWLPRSSYELAEQYDFEQHYRARDNMDEPEVHIFVPLRHRPGPDVRL